jgi:serralysin
VLALVDAVLLRTQSFGNVNAAEKALGVELDGLPKHADPKAFVTVAFADANGDGVADFGVALIGVKSLGAGDVLSNQAEPLPTDLFV